MKRLLAVVVALSVLSLAAVNASACPPNLDNPNSGYLVGPQESMPTPAWVPGPVYRILSYIERVVTYPFTLFSSDTGRTGVSATPIQLP